MNAPSGPVFAKLLGKGHATARLLLRNGRSITFSLAWWYRAIDQKELRNRREHSVEYIRTKLTILDFVLARPDYQYLETEAEKVDYFGSKLRMSKAFLPSKQRNAAELEKIMFPNVPKFAEAPELIH